MNTVSGRRSTLALMIGPKSSTSRRYSPGNSGPAFSVPTATSGLALTKERGQGDESHGSASRDPPDHHQLYSRRPAPPPGGPDQPPTPDPIIWLTAIATPAATAAPATTSPAIHLISRASRACRWALRRAEFGPNLAEAGLPLGPHQLDFSSQRLNIGLGRERGQRGLDGRQASLDVERGQIGRHRFPRTPVPVRLWTSSRTWAPLLLYRLTSRPDLNHPRCTHRGRPFDAASIVAARSHSERLPSPASPIAHSP